jgi:hypothetical protein
VTHLHRSYWVFSAATAIVWAVALVVSWRTGAIGRIWPVAGGWWLAWIALTIAREVYPPPRRWLGRD